MRTIIRFVLGAIAAVNLSFIWTVGQTGLSQTNKNLCELWASMRKAVPESLPGLPEYQNCEFERLLVYGALAASAAIISWFAIEVLLWALKRRRKASQQDTELRIGMTMRELQAQHEQASALREHTEELRRQREAEQRAVPLIAQRPRLKCSFSMHDTGCIKPNTPYNEVLLAMSRAVLKFARQASLFEQATRPWLAVQDLG